MPLRKLDRAEHEHRSNSVSGDGTGVAGPARSIGSSGAVQPKKRSDEGQAERERERRQQRRCERAPGGVCRSKRDDVRQDRYQRGQGQRSGKSTHS